MSKPILRVNGTPISDTDLENAVQGYAMELHRKTMDQLSADERKEIEALAREKLVARQLIYQEALARGMVADDEAVLKEEAKIMRNFPSEEEFYATLEKAGLDRTAYHRMIRQDLSVNMLTEQQAAEVEEPSAEEVERVYRENPDKMQKPCRVRACHILAKFGEEGRDKALERIAEIEKRLGSEDFAQLAQEHSQCPSGARGGDLGFFQKGTMVKAFEEAVFALKVGEVGPVVETQFGFHLVKLIDRQEAAPLDLAEAEPKIRKFLKDEAGARHLKDWVAGLRSRAVIEEEP
ncbi:MAG: hypothetical protein C0617_05760 [Desulfuromonas sp.]|uniref:peptidylprolyl isomerase n=1 Tax=Desulfuromonas sp. TaxID=892 RepID=UPI000CBB783D|nr:peptidylprolyl isomerase [Desulfuromonas sp.]PLX85189.1 MAG: hypothetical protein C0617_05760 [Desulfuromonas sp.]